MLHNEDFPLLRNSQRGMGSADAGAMLLGRNEIALLQRWFAGTRYIDEVEALCVELLKQVFSCRYADHRLMGSMLGAGAGLAGILVAATIYGVYGVGVYKARLGLRHDT